MAVAGSMTSAMAPYSLAALPRKLAGTNQKLGVTVCAGNRHPRRLVCRAEVGQSESTCLGSSAWKEFGKAVQGEWEGATSTFARDGEVRPLPEYYVPDAYREWDVKVVDWTHMTSSLVTDDGLENNVKKFMPTVGCEADAVAFEEDIHNALKAEDGQESEAKTISVKGCYSLGTRVLAEEGDEFKKHRIENCLVGNSGERVRMVYEIRRRDAASPWQVFGIEVYDEKYVGEYNKGAELRSCGGNCGYGEKERTTLADVQGTWEPVSVDAYTCNEDLALRGCEAPEREVTDMKDALLLPLGVWSCFHESGADVKITSGWVYDSNKQVVISRGYTSNKLSSIVIRDEIKST